MLVVSFAFQSFCTTEEDLWRPEKKRVGRNKICDAEEHTFWNINPECRACSYSLYRLNYYGSRKHQSSPSSIGTERFAARFMVQMFNWSFHPLVSLPIQLFLWEHMCLSFLGSFVLHYLYVYCLKQGFPTFFEWRHTWQNLRDSVTPHSRWDPHPHFHSIRKENT
jgi:hypothetical protein